MGLGVYATDDLFDPTKEDIDDADDYLSYKSENDAHISYSGYLWFRNELLDFFSKGEIDLDSHYDPKEKRFYKDDKSHGVYDFACSYHNEKTYEPCMDKEALYKDLINEKQDTEEADKYFEKLDAIKDLYPEIYELYPMLAHSDCEGYLSCESCKMIIPVLKKYIKESTLKEDHPYLSYAKDYLAVAEEVVRVNGWMCYC